MGIYGKVYGMVEILEEEVCFKVKKRRSD